MVTDEAQKITQLLKSSQGASRRLGRQLMDSLNAVEAVKNCIEQEMGYACFQELTQLKATHIFQTELETNTQEQRFLKALDQLEVDPYHRRRINQVFLELSVWAKTFCQRETTNFLVDISESQCVFLLKETIWKGYVESPIVSLEYFNTMAQDQQLMKSTLKRIVKSRKKGYPDSLYDLSFLDIIRKTHSPVQYALYPTENDELELIFMKATLDLLQEPPPKRKHK